jgi:hypothetical protein
VSGPGGNARGSAGRLGERCPGFAIHPRIVWDSSTRHLLDESESAQPNADVRRSRNNEIRGSLGSVYSRVPSTPSVSPDVMFDRQSLSSLWAKAFCTLRFGCHGRSPSAVTRIAVKRQNIGKWPPRRHGGCLVKDKGFADADQKLRHGRPSGHGADEVAAGL